MNVYFVNRYSKLKGPFNITDSNREHIIRVGDICLRDSYDGVIFLLVRTNDNKWSSCIRIGIGDNKELIEIGNTLLFSFDGISQREGNISLLKTLMNCFGEQSIIAFFDNALKILEYKRDSWDLRIFQQFLTPSEVSITPKVEYANFSNSKEELLPTIFAQYLSEKLLRLLKILLNEGKDLKEVYYTLREKDPEAFRSALLKFLSDNPNKTIYERPIYQGTHPINYPL